MNHFLFRGLAGGMLCALFSSAALADYDTFFVDAAQGDTITNVRLGMGETPSSAEGEKVTNMLYLGYFKSDDLVKVDDVNMGSDTVEILTLGTGGFGYLNEPYKNGGAEFDFELSNTKLDQTDYDRTAIGFKTQLFIPVIAGLQANFGFNLRPFFLSADWDDQADLEVEYQAGIEYAFNWDIALYSHYRKLDAHSGDVTMTFAEDVVFGLRARF
jgi:hypothetical protein